MNKVEIYVETIANSGIYEPLDLFEDEKVTLKYIFKRYDDISKVFTSFSRTFTVPADGRNKLLLKNFLEPEVKRTADSRFLNCKLIVNRILKQGKINIIGGKQKKGRTNIYTLAFSTGVPNLKDLIGNDTLADLPDFGLSLIWNNGQIYQYMTNPPIQGTYGTNPDLYIPLISNQRVWTYSDTPSTNNIKFIDSSIPSGGVSRAIKADELRPAIRYRNIYDAIISKYGLMVNCPVTNRPEFNDIYVHCTKEKYDDWTYETTFTHPFNTVSGSLVSDWDVSVDLNTEIVSITAANATTQVCVFESTLFNPMSVLNSTTDDVKATLRFIDMRPGKVGNLLYSKELTASTEYDNPFLADKLTLSPTIFGGINPATPLLFKIEWVLNDKVTFDSTRFSITVKPALGSLFYFKGSIGNTPNTTVLQTINPQRLLPNIKVIDWLTSFFKMFNISIVEKRDTNELLWLTPVDSGLTEDDMFELGEKDYTPYVDIDENNVDGQKLYRLYDFKYKESKYKSNIDFAKANQANPNSKAFGQVLQKVEDNVFFTEEYKIENTYSIVPPRIIEGTRVLTQYGFDDSQPTEDADFGNLYNPNFDEFTLFYCNGIQQLKDLDKQNISFAFREGTVNSKVDTYVKSNIANTDNIATYVNSLGYKDEVNLLPTQFVCDRNLFSNYYSTLIRNLKDQNILIYEFEAYLPAEEIVNFDVRNTIIIGERAYKIVETDIEVTTGKTKLKLTNKPLGSMTPSVVILPSMYTIDGYANPLLAFTVNYGDDTTMILQISIDNGINWDDTVVTTMNPLNIGAYSPGTLVRLKSSSDNTVSNNIAITGTAMWKIESYRLPFLYFTKNYGDASNLMLIQISTSKGVIYTDILSSSPSPKTLGTYAPGTRIRIKSLEDGTLSNEVIVARSSGELCTISNAFTSSSVCRVPANDEVSASTQLAGYITDGDILYLNSRLTTNFVGDPSKFYKIVNGFNIFVVSVDANGIVLSSDQCL